MLIFFCVWICYFPSLGIVRQSYLRHYNPRNCSHAYRVRSHVYLAIKKKLIGESLLPCLEILLRRKKSCLECRSHNYEMWKSRSRYGTKCWTQYLTGIGFLLRLQRHLSNVETNSMSLRKNTRPMKNWKSMRHII